MSKFLFTTLPSNDLGLLTRSLPIARELTEQGNEVVFSSPGKAPDKLISEAGYKNLIPVHPMYQLSFNDLNLKGFIRFLKTRPWKKGYRNIFDFFFQLIRSIPIKFAPATPEVWSMDHAAAMAGMMNTNFVKALCKAYMKLIDEFNPVAIVDFWNPLACIAVKALRKPLISVIQADAHPAGKGFIWWKETPNNIPSAVPAINKTLKGFGLSSILKTEELSLGDLTLILGTPETDPLPEASTGEYIVRSYGKIAILKFLPGLKRSRRINRLYGYIQEIHATLQRVRLWILR